MSQFVYEIMPFVDRYAMTVNFAFNTAVIETKGYKQALSKRSRYKLGVSISGGMLTRAEADELIEFYRDRGQQESFLFKNLLFYQLGEDGFNGSLQLIDIVEGVYRYQIVGSVALAGVNGNAIYSQPIYYPVVNTVSVKVEGVTPAGITININGGIVTSPNAIADNVVVECEFYHRMRFSTNTFSVKEVVRNVSSTFNKTVEAWEFEGLELEQDLTPFALVSRSTYNTVDVEITKLKASKSQVAESRTRIITAGGIEKREEQAKTNQINYGSQVFPLSTAREVLSHFLCCKGKGVTFKMGGQAYRYKSDTISFTALSYAKTSTFHQAIAQWDFAGISIETAATVNVAMAGADGINLLWDVPRLLKVEWANEWADKKADLIQSISDTYGIDFQFKNPAPRHPYASSVNSPYQNSNPGNASHQAYRAAILSAYGHDTLNPAYDSRYQNTPETITAFLELETESRPIKWGGWQLWDGSQFKASYNVLLDPESWYMVYASNLGLTGGLPTDTALTVKTRERIIESIFMDCEFYKQEYLAGRVKGLKIIFQEMPPVYASWLAGEIEYTPYRSMQDWFDTWGYPPYFDWPPAANNSSGFASRDGLASYSWIANDPANPLVFNYANPFKNEYQDWFWTLQFFREIVEGGDHPILGKIKLKNYNVGIEVVPFDSDNIDYDPFITSGNIFTHYPGEMGYYNADKYLEKVQEAIGATPVPKGNKTNSLSYAPVMRIELQDGSYIWRTSWDHAITIGAVTIQPGAFDTTSSNGAIGLSLDNVEVTGILENLPSPLSTAAIAAGVLDHAPVRLCAVDVRSLPPSIDDASVIQIASGFVGNVTVDEMGYTLQIIGLSAALNRAVSIQTSTKCQWLFGDKRCNVNVDAISVNSAVVSLSGSMRINISGNHAENRYQAGYVRFTSGNLKNASYPIVSNTANQLQLASTLPVAPQAGDTLKIIPGCSGSLDECKDYGGNFGGFPTGPNWFVGIDEAAARST